MSIDKDGNLSGRVTKEELRKAIEMENDKVPVEGTYQPRWPSQQEQKPKDVTSTSLPLAPLPQTNAPKVQADPTSDAARANDPASAKGGGTPVQAGSSAVTVASVGDKDQKIGDLSEIKWQGNPLSNYRNYTYSFTLAACGDEPPVTDYEEYIAAKQSDDSAQKYVILAQTGSTKYNILDCQIDGLVGPDFRNANTFTTNITMTITEPLGMSFLDSLKNTAEVLKIKNFSKMYYFLELSFKAYNEDGVAVNKGSGGVGFDENGGDSESGRKKYGFMLWKVVFKNIETAVNEGGATYTITMIPMNEQGYDDYIFRLAAPVKCSGKTTEEAINSLATMLNEDVKKRYLGREVIKYNFEIKSDKLKGYQMKTDDPFATNTSDVNNQGNPEQQSPKGMTVAQMIDAIYMNSTMVKEWEEHFKNPEDRLTTPMKLLKVETDIKYKEYDPMLGDYVKEVTYRIYPYEYWRAILTKEQFDGRKEKSQDIFKRLVDNRFLVKRYDYIYTGRNSEVLTFDIKFNLAWAALVNVFDGARRGYAAVSEAPLHNEKMSEQIYNIDAQVMRGISIIENYLAQQGTDEVLMDDGQKVNLMQEAGEMARIHAELLDLNDAYAQGKRDGFEAKIKTLSDDATKVVEKANQIERARMNSVFDLWGKDDDGKARFRRFAEDVNTRTSKDLKDELMPMTFHRTPQDVTTEHGGGSLGDWNIGKAVMGAVLNQAYGMAEKELQRINIEIRGDPYWLGNSNMEKLGQNVEKSPTDFPYFSLGEHCALVTFRYPVKIDDNTSKMELSGSETFNGVYMINKVTHTFSGGMFKQTLQGLRCPVIIVDKIVMDNFGRPAPKLPNGDPNNAPQKTPQGQQNTMLAQAVDNKQAEIKKAESALAAANAEKASLQSKINVAQATGNAALVKELRQEQAALEETIKEKQSLLDQGLEELASLRDRIGNAVSDAYDYVADGVSSVYNSVADGLGEFASNAQRDAEGFAGAIGGAAKQADADIASVYQNAGNSFNDLFG